MLGLPFRALGAITVLAVLLWPAALPIRTQSSALVEIIREYNAGTLSDARLQALSARVAGQPPAFWEISTEEYAALVVSLSRQLSERGAAALPIVEGGLQQIEPLTGRSSPELLPLLDELIRVQEERTMWQQAATTGARALEIATAAVGSSHPSLVDRQRAQARRLERAGSNPAEAQRLLEQAASLEAVAQRQSEQLMTMNAGDAKPADANSELVRVFFATNRERRPDSHDPRTYFSSRRSRSTPDLTYGDVMVSVPRAFELVGIRDGRHWVGEIRKGDYHKAVLVNLTEFGSAASFVSTLRRHINSTRRRELLVFVHGYANDWQASVQKAAALSVALELDGAPLVFSWPSRGDVLSYVADGNELTMRAVEQLAGVLRAAVNDSGADRVYIVCHSMGARFVLSALERLSATERARPSFSSIVFASPDVDAGDFSDRAPAISRLSKATTMYVSARDRALGLSRFVNDAVRAGDVRANLAPPGIDAVDTTRSSRDMWNLDGLIGHDDFATGALDDLRALLWHGLKPTSRCILAPRKVAAGVVWDLGGSGCSPGTFKMGVHAARRLGAAEAASFLAINERESCRTSPAGTDCRLWGAARVVAESIQAGAPK